MKLEQSYHSPVIAKEILVDFRVNLNFLCQKLYKIVAIDQIITSYEVNK